MTNTRAGNPFDYSHKKMVRSQHFFFTGTIFQRKRELDEILINEKFDFEK